jgi:Raf kinase inhibitor-like YbhB/YbcL family protein
MYTLKILSAAAMALAALSFTGVAGLVVKSAAFTENGMIPSDYSCDGKEVSPPLNISNIPANTKSLAIILHDPDAPMQGGFTHWVVWNIAPDGNIPEDFKGADQGLNGTGQAGYKGMCPPSGTHHYHFKIYALDTKLDLDKKTDKAALEKSMQGHILADADFVGLYKKMK